MKVVHEKSALFLIFEHFDEHWMERKGNLHCLQCLLIGKSRHFAFNDAWLSFIDDSDQEGTLFCLSSAGVDVCPGPDEEFDDEFHDELADEFALRSEFFAEESLAESL